MPTAKRDTPAPRTKRAVVDLPELARWVAQESAMFNDDGTPFHAHVHAGDRRLVVVTGENASGKSLLFRILAAKINEAGALPVTLSIRERTGSGSGEMAGFRRIAMFGEEYEQSTGATSVTALQTAFKNLDRPQGSVLGLDEPELGLSDGYAAALGRYVAEQIKALPRACSGVVVVTHSRSLVAGLVAGRRTAPTFVSVGQDVTLKQWLAEPEVRTVDELLALSGIGLERFRWAAAATRNR